MWKPFISQNIIATGGFTYENGILTPAEAKRTCTRCSYVDEAIMPPIKCPVCKGTNFVTT